MEYIAVVEEPYYAYPHDTAVEMKAMVYQVVLTFHFVVMDYFDLNLIETEYDLDFVAARFDAVENQD